MNQTGGNRFVVSPRDLSRGVIQTPGGIFDCAIGRNGATAIKTEGDGATPAGVYPLRNILYRSDRLEKPLSGLPIYPLDKDNGWCDTPDHPDYNRFVHLPHPAHCEELWREDRIYDVIIVMAYNDNPVRSGKGSAIFMHVAQPCLKPTEGCIALVLEDLMVIVNHLDKDSLIDIQPG